MAIADAKDYVNNYRKRIFYIICSLGLVGIIVNLSFGFFSSNLTQTQTTGRVINSTLLIIMFMGCLALTRINRVSWAAMIFCTMGTLGTTFGIFNYSLNNPLAGLESFFSIFYIVIVVVAYTFITPLAGAIFGSVGLVFYLSITTFIIIQSPVNVPAEKGVNIAIFSLILFSITGLLYGFSENLSRMARETRQQSEQLNRLNRFLQKQRSMESQLSHRINELTGTFTLVFSEQNLTSQEQSNLISDVATTTQELDAAARRIADNALSVATVAEKAQRSIEVGQQAAYQGVTTIASMRERVTDINESMRTLNQQIERISEITAIIGEIADETNLLALNAAIEAAGAKEYGRRFAAVAEEVQRLARRSTSAVEQIKETVAEINEARARAVIATEQGLREANVGDQLVGSLSVANEDVTHLVAQTSTLAASIASSTQQQRQASAQIVDVIQRLTHASAELNEAGPKIHHLVVSLEQASDKLRKITDDKPQFTLLAATSAPPNTSTDKAKSRRSRRLLKRERA